MTTPKRRAPAADGGSSKSFNWFRVVLIGFGGTWQTFLIVRLILPYPHRTGSVLFGLLWGILPYVVLAALARQIRNRVVLILAAAIQCVTHVMVGMDALHPQRSTAGLGLGLQPLFGIFILIPSAILLGYLIGRVRSSTGPSAAGRNRNG